MIGVYDFCGHYEWTFEWFRRMGGEELVQEYWREAISNDSQRHARALIVEGGFAGMLAYWTPVLEEEGGESVTRLYDDVLRVDMHDCPSKGFLLRNGLEQYHDYCNHCIAWVNPLMKEAGFRIDHQHNHRGQCWWEFRHATDNRPPSAPGEVSGGDDIRLLPMWNPSQNIESFLNEGSGSPAPPLTNHVSRVPLGRHVAAPTNVNDDVALPDPKLNPRENS